MRPAWIDVKSRIASVAVDVFGLFQPAAALRGLANNHGIHHGGQFAACLGACGSRVSATHGGSADEPTQASGHGSRRTGAGC